MAIDRYLPRIAAVTILAALLVVASTAAGAWWQLRAAQRASYAVGDRVDIPGELYSSTPQTLVLFVRSTCPVCQEEAGRLQKASTTLSSPPYAVPTVIVTGSSNVEDDRAFAAGFQRTTHVHVPFSRLRVQTVPTTLLIDRHGTVLFSQEGRSKTKSLMEELIRRIPSR